jgi:hypothetical protein
MPTHSLSFTGNKFKVVKQCASQMLTLFYDVILNVSYFGQQKQEVLTTTS